MSIFRKTKSTAYAKMQTAKGSAATPAAADALDTKLETGYVQPKGEVVDRGLTRGGRWPSKRAIIGRWGEGSLQMEVRGSGTAGTEPEFAPLLQTLLGTLVSNAAGTVETGSGAVGGFDSALELTVGQLVRVDVSGTYEIRRIDSKTGVGPYTYTVHRDFSAAPADGATIAAGVSFLHLGTESEQYFTLDQYLDGLRLICADAVCESLELGVNAREIIAGTFGVRSLSCAESAATDSMTPVYDDTDPLTGTSCNLLVDGSALDMRSMSLNLTTRRSRGGINSSGYADLPFMHRFDATCTLAPWVEDAAPITAFFAASLVDVEMTRGDTEGNILHVLAEDLQRTGPSIGEDEGDYSWDDPLQITGGVTIGFF